MAKTLGLFLSFMLPLATLAASFDCSKASSNVEKAICDNEQLSALDESLALAYKRALSSKNIKESVRESQRTWLQKHRGICDLYQKDRDQVTSCLKRIYDERLLILNALATPKENIFGTYIRTVPVCFVGKSSDKPDCNGEVDNKITILEGTTGIDVSMELYFFNGHLCEFEGTGAWKDGRVIVKGNETETKCTFELYSDGRRVTSRVSDEMGIGCHYYCGARGSLDNAYAEKSN